jgi:hypothetical protein
MNFVEGVHKEQDNQKGFVPSSKELHEYSEEQTEIGKLFQKDLQDLELWKNNLLQKCEARESAGEDCSYLRRIIEDEYTEKKIELHERVHYVDRSAKHKKAS